MICVTDCTEAKCLLVPSVCNEVQDLEIGTGEINTDYTVYFYNETTNKTESVNVTSDGTGLITVSLLDVNVNPHGVYYVWATLEDVPMVDKEDIDVDGETYTCFILTFERVFIGGVVQCPTTQTIEI